MPWLREHLAGLIGELLGALDVNPSGLLRLPDASDLRALLDRVREDGLAFVAVGEERRGQLEGAQAFMALLEGYAEHVMDAVGADLLTDLDAMRAAMERRRHERSGLLRVLEKLIGHGPQAAPVQAGQGVLRRGRGARRDRGAQPRLGRPGDAAGLRRARRSGRAGWRAPSASDSAAAPRERRHTSFEPAFVLLQSRARIFRVFTWPSRRWRTKSASLCNGETGEVYKQVFDG